MSTDDSYDRVRHDFELLEVVAHSVVGIVGRHKQRTVSGKTPFSDRCLNANPVEACDVDVYQKRMVSSLFSLYGSLLNGGRF